MAASSQKAVGILGGTFDPVHDGHLRVALELYQILNFQHIRFVPCKIPVHKAFTHASAEQRLAMLQIAINQQDGFVVDDRELTRDSPSYMVDTLKSLKAEFNAPLCLILGTDAFTSLPTWNRFESILALCHIVVAIRPGQNFTIDEPLQALLEQYQLDDWAGLHQNSAGHIFIQSVTQLDISATEIRAQLQGGYSPRFLLPDPVLEYIQSNSIYHAR